MKVGRAILEAGGSAIEAAVEACVLLEDDPVFNAGTGSVVRTDGSVLTDASLQTGDGRLGFVIAMEDTPNPIRICVDLLDEEINGLAGPGARRWADARGHLKADVIGRPAKDEIGDVGDVGPKPAEIIGDTVGVIARDSQGNIAAATSTGGCSHRPAG
jgi:beta-aspartyl-peptidase (threonine type)